MTRTTRRLVMGVGLAFTLTDHRTHRSAAGGDPGGRHLRARPLRGNALADDRPVPSGPNQGRRRNTEPAQRLLHRRRQRRRLEDNGLRSHLESHLRRPAHWLDRRDSDRTIRFEHHLRGQRRMTATPRPLCRRGIYKSTDAGETWTHLGLRDGQQIPQIHHRPGRPRPPLCRGPRAPIRAQRAARRLPIARRWTKFSEGALHG